MCLGDGAAHVSHHVDGTSTVNPIKALAHEGKMQGIPSDEIEIGQSTSATEHLALGQHGLGPVQSHHEPTAPQYGRESPGEIAGAASDVQNALPLLQPQQLDGQLELFIDASFGHQTSQCGSRKSFIDGSMQVALHQCLAETVSDVVEGKKVEKTMVLKIVSVAGLTTRPRHGEFERAVVTGGTLDHIIQIDNLFEIIGEWFVGHGVFGIIFQSESVYYRWLGWTLRANYASWNYDVVIGVDLIGTNRRGFWNRDAQENG